MIKIHKRTIPRPFLFGMPGLPAVATTLLFLWTTTTTFMVPIHGYTGEFRRRDMAGLWRLSGVDSTLLQNRIEQESLVQPYPLKEFTVYPKKKPKKTIQTAEANANDTNEPKEVLIMLSEDGSFKQYGSDDDTALMDDEEDEDDDGTSSLQQQQKLEQELHKHLTLHQKGLRILQGTWDFLDGKLILAADRPTTDERDEEEKHDTILVGEVVAISEQSLQDNPVLSSSATSSSVQEKDKDSSGLSNKDAKPSQEDTDKHPNDITASQSSSSSSSLSSSSSTAATTTTASTSSTMDTHLSVPDGKVEIGKFFYPKTHPSFFDQPIYRPKSKGSFSLKQVLGNLNTARPEDKDIQIEKFNRNDFISKKFVLTSYPLPKHKPKGELRWSIKYNKFVRDPPSKKTPKSQQNDEEETPMPLRVMEIAFFKNHTFTTLGGLGEMVLRGKWDVIGQQKDQFWMQVWRFGFGRSAPGSTFSEGVGLSHTDEKAYWGRIEYEHKNEKKKDGNKDKDDTTTSMTEKMDGVTQSSINDNEDEEEISRIEVRGSVLDGWGLEPEPVAKFIMREATEAELYDDEEDDDEDDDDDDDMDVTYSEDDDAEPDGLLDWSDSFQ